MRPKHRPACKDIMDIMLCDLGEVGLKAISRLSDSLTAMSKSYL